MSYTIALLGRLGGTRGGRPSDMTVQLVNPNGSANGTAQTGAVELVANQGDYALTATVPDSFDGAYYWRDHAVYIPGTMTRLTPAEYERIDEKLSAIQFTLNVTAGQIAAQILDSDVTQHATPGTFGQRMNPYGIGIHEVDLTIVDAVTGAGVEGAEVWLTATDDPSAPTVAGPVYTDANGHTRVWLNAGTYYQWAKRDVYRFPDPAVLVVPAP